MTATEIRTGMKLLWTKAGRSRIVTILGPWESEECPLGQGWYRARLLDGPIIPVPIHQLDHV